MRILIVEDENSLADLISARLKKEKYLTDISHDGEDGYYKASIGVYDLIILDVMLPGMNGFEILKKLRENNIDSKIIMLTAKSGLDDKLEGFENGANDYLTKPFHMDELAARVNVQLKIQSRNNNILEYGDLKLDILKSRISRKGTDENVELVCKEMQILEYFMNNKGQILSKEQIYDKVWGIDNEIESNTLEVYLSFVRRKLKAIGANVTIKAVRGLGYKMELEDE